MSSDSSPPRARALQETLDLARQGSKGRRSLFFAAAGIAGVLAIAALLLTGGGESGALRYSSVPAEQGDLRVTVSATGTLEPVNQVDVGTEISGTIRAVEVDFNDRVKRDQVLARLDTDELQAEVLEARANLEAADARVSQGEATLEETRLKHQRCEEMARSDFCSREELDTAEAAYLRAKADVKSARAQVQVARASLDAKKTRLEKAEIRSPIDGLVLSRNIEPGQTVAASLQTPVLFVLAEDLRDMELHIDVDEADVGLVREGQPATFTVDAYVDRHFPATLVQVRFAPQAEEGVVTYETVLRVDNRELLLRPGMTATAEVIVADVEDSLLVPNAALRFEPPVETDSTDQNSTLFSRLFPRPRRHAQRESSDAVPRGSDQNVWVLRDGEPVSVAVQVGLSDGARTQITGGELAAGDLVVTGIDRAAP